MRNEVESIWEIKVHSISLTLAAENRSQKLKKRHQIGNYRFGSDEAMLIGINLA
jgi:hypothetical protein